MHSAVSAAAAAALRPGRLSPRAACDRLMSSS
jgi:hypothetical protein